MRNRIKELRKTLDLTQQEFADKLGIKRGAIANYEIGRNEPIDSVISLMCREFNVNEQWLRNGTGEMFIQLARDEKIASFIGSIQRTEDITFQKRFVSMLADMSVEEWELLEKMVVRLSNDMA